MDKVNINTKMEISLKEIILRMKKGERGNTISVKVVFWSPSLIRIHHKYLKYI